MSFKAPSSNALKLHCWRPDGIILDILLTNRKTILPHYVLIVLSTTYSPINKTIDKILGSPDPGDSKHGTSLPHRPGGVHAIAGGGAPPGGGPVTYYTAHNGDSLQAAPGEDTIQTHRLEIIAMF